MATFLAQGHLLGDQTLFRSVRRLRGGEFLRIEDGRIVSDVYWRFAPGSAVGETSRADLERELGQLVEAAVAQHLGDPAKTMIFLSGGADSRGILGGALSVVKGNGALLNTVSWGANEGSRDSDVAVAATIAHSVGTNHRFVQRQTLQYRENFTRVNQLIDGLSEIAAFHPHEHQIMVDLRAAGFERALRGDEVFGCPFPAKTTRDALSLVKLHRLRDVRGMGSAIRAEYLTPLCEASDNAIDSALDEVRDLDPDRAKDYLYYVHRLQCYLQPASYYKQVELDQRNALLDEPILDFMSRVPARLRIDKRLYRDAMARTYPELARFPAAKRDNLENWTALLAAETPVRAFVQEELSDRSSGIWEYLDPVALKGTLEAMARPTGDLLASTPQQRLKFRVKHALGGVAPWLLFRVQTRIHTRPVFRLEPEKLVMRALVLKHWHDTFVAQK